MFGFKRRRRQRLMEEPFPDEWLHILVEHVPYFHHLPTELQKKLQGMITVFLDEQTFEGCAGLNITDEIRVTIAAQACILMLGLDDLSSFYEGLRSVLVYPKHYVAKVKTQHDGFFVEEGFQSRNGEAWQRGHVVLAWDAVQKGASDIHDGKNLVFHEFAHQLDYEYAATNRADNGANNSSEDSLSTVLEHEYQHFLQALRHHQETLLDEYGATNIAEFFAVVTESFFESPVELKQNHPELYEQLQTFYHQDPGEYLKDKK